jgi:hypothetical protein
VSFNHADDSPAAANPILAQGDFARRLREQEPACRGMAVQARTRAGKQGPGALADNFDEQARKIDPTSMRR